MKERDHIHGGLSGAAEERRRLDIVLKCDSAGSEEAVISSLRGLVIPHVEVRVIDSGIGDVSKSDLLMAITGSRLVVGFSVGVMPKLEELSHEQGVEIRLYDVIYRLTSDIEEIAGSLIQPEERERITGRAKVIALFKSGRRGIILGCEVLEGTLATGKNFRVISAMGPVYTGKIESLQIEKRPVREATRGQQVGLKISNFKKAREGNLVECFEMERPKTKPPWQPSGKVIPIFS